VRNMTAEGQYLKAEQLCRYFLQSNQKHVEGMRLLADLGVKSGVLDDAEFLLESAVEFEPNNRFARYDYVGVLYRRQKYKEALEQATWLKDKHPGNLDYQVAYANQCVAVGDYESALPIFEDSIKLRPARSDLHLVYGHALKTIGKVDEAITSYRNAYEARADFGDAFWSLANLKTYRFTDEEVARMQKAEDSVRTVLDDRAHLCFALGKHYEDGENFERSIEFYERGNALRRAQLRYDADDMTRRLTLQKKEVGAETLKSRTGCESSAPIFIVGLPRAGSTLLEQILASHSAVDGTLELPNIPALAFRLGGRQRADQAPRYPAILNELDAEKFAQFGESYIKDTQVHRSGADYFIDKMPNNFRHIGLIQKILPNAKIIDARRHPMACCFSGYKQLFASGQEFTYGLKEIGQYYRDYVELMDHWDALMPERILRVYYEDVVADLETQVRRILDYCGLAFEPACLEFHKTDRSVRTPSAEQVRQPIYKSGLAQWQHFEPWLDPLKAALGDALDQYPR
ncbi:MAG: sulfotransferase, partial [Pseudomonadota bacterium]